VQLLEAVAQEASERGVDPSTLDGFVGLSAVGRFLAELHGEAPRASLLEYGTLVFHAVHFMREGMPLFLLDRRAARSLVESAPAAEPSPPVRAGYLQLPQHLFWTRIEGTSPESVDGLFWTVSSDERTYVLPVTGVRPDRPGFGTLAVPDAPLAHAAEWVRARVRETGDDFGSDLPGAQLDGLYAITAAGEILKLMARFFAQTAARRGVVERPANDVTGPRPSALGYTRVRAGE
jgi:hypothetical protein